MKKKNDNLLRSPCCGAYPRVQLYQSALVEINKEGEREQVWNFSEVDVELDKIWCDECGNDLDLVYPKGDKPCYLRLLQVSKTSK